MVKVDVSVYGDPDTFNKTAFIEKIRQKLNTTATIEVEIVREHKRAGMSQNSAIQHCFLTDFGIAENFHVLANITYDSTSIPATNSTPEALTDGITNTYFAFSNHSMLIPLL